MFGISPQVCPQQESETNRIIFLNDVFISLNELAKVQIFLFEMISTLFQQQEYHHQMVWW